MKSINELNEASTPKLDMDTLIVLAQTIVDKLSKKGKLTTKEHPYKMELQSAIDTKDKDNLFRLLTRKANLN